MAGARGTVEAAPSTWRAYVQDLGERITRPSPFVEAPERRRRARLLASLLLFFTAAALVLTLLVPPFVAPGDPGNAALYPVGLGAATIGVALYAVSRSPQYEGAAWLSVAGILVSVSYSTFANQGTIWGEGAPYFLTLGVIFASVLLPLYATVLVSFVVLAVLIVYFLFFPGFTLLQLYSQLAFYALACSVLVFTAVARHFDMRQMEATNRAIVLSEVRARELLDTAQALAVHRDGRILELTTPFARLLHAAPGELVGGRIMGLFADRDKGRATAALTASEETNWEADIVRLDGRTVHVQAVTRPVQYLGAPAFVLEMRASRHGGARNGANGRRRVRIGGT